VSAGAVALAALLAGAAPPAARPSPDAPLGVRTQGSFREPFLDVTIADARLPPRPELDVRWTVANSWGTPMLLERGGALAELVTDEQADALTLALRVPWRALRGGATAVEWRLTQHWGGWSDGVISAWHDVLRVFDFHRDRYPRDAIRLRLGAPGGGGPVDLRRARLAGGDLVVRNQLALAGGGASRRGAGERWALALRLDVKAPVGSVSRAGGSGGWDAGAALLATAEVARRLTVHGALSMAAWSDLPRSSPLQPRRWHPAAELSLAVALGRWTLLLEDRVAGALFEGGWSYVGLRARQRTTSWVAAFRPHNQVSVGLRRGAFTAWFSEDATPGSGGGLALPNAPDLAVGLAYARPL
jgi:hypothetical protein